MKNAQTDDGPESEREEWSSVLLPLLLGKKKNENRRFPYANEEEGEELQ